MPKYEKAERVLFRDVQTGCKTRGRITGWDGTKYRVVTDSRQRRQVHPRHIKKESPDRILFLEGRLDRNLRSRRSFGDVFKKLVACYGSELLHEKVHTKEDLRAFLRREGRQPDFRYIHLMAHGEDTKGKGRVKLCLTHEKFDLVDNQDIFADLRGKIIIFSSCELGNDAPAMEAIRDASGAAAVIAYRCVIDDYYTNIAELLLYHELIENRRSPAKAVALVREMLRVGGIKISEHKTRAPVIRCFTSRGIFE